jgi:peptidoglycan/xylan/chitin deacetylase (PgdA/CDA1 family)
VSVRARVSPVAKQTIKAVASVGDVVVRPAPGITILIYHRVGAGTGGEMDLDPRVFEEQLAVLRSGHRLVTLDEAVAELRGSDPIEPGVVVTFDDGTADWVDQVLPAIERHRVPATFYVATDFVERGVPFPGDGTPITWAGLRELAASPLVTIGSHTHRHALMDRLAEEEIDDELDRSIELLRDRLGIEAEHFCYPKAVAGSPAAERAIRSRFRSAVLGGTRSNQPGADPYRLARTPVQRSDGERWFERKVAGGMRLEDDLRRGVNRLRYRGASS